MSLAHQGLFVPLFNLGRDVYTPVLKVVLARRYKGFLIGGDGKVYEGVGWHKIGAHTKGYNTMALGITLIGNFSDKLPPKVQLEALKKLLECGVKMGELDPDFKLLAHRQLIATESPGMTLFLELQNWPEWAEHL